MRIRLVSLRIFDDHNDQERRQKQALMQKQRLQNAKVSQFRKKLSHPTSKLPVAQCSFSLFWFLFEFFKMTLELCSRGDINGPHPKTNIILKFSPFQRFILHALEVENKTHIPGKPLFIDQIISMKCTFRRLLYFANNSKCSNNLLQTCTKGKGLLTLHKNYIEAKKPL